jgi:hypothetical protein
LTESKFTKLEIRSDEVQEILEDIPHWFIRYGNTVILGVLAIFIFLSWVIKYPDVIVSKIILTTKVPPVHLVARSSGRIDFIASDKQEIRKGERLGVIENPAKTEDVFWLINQLSHFNTSNSDSFFFETKDSLLLGDINTSYQLFVRALSNFYLTNNIDFYDHQIKSIAARISYYRHLNQQLSRQEQFLVEETELLCEAFKADSTLSQTKFISKLERDRSKMLYLQSRRNLESARGDITSNLIQIKLLEGQIDEFEMKRTEQNESLYKTILESKKELESQIKNWEQNYLVISPINGTVSFTNYWSDNQFIKSGEELMVIVPEISEIIAQLEAPMAQSGKIEIGQTVNIKLDNYPVAEYGAVEGRIESISMIPVRNVYSIKVSLPKGLTTSYKRELTFRQEIQGTAEIITNDMRLIERILNQVRNLIDNAS